MVTYHTLKYRGTRISTESEKIIFCQVGSTGRAILIWSVVQDQRRAVGRELS